MLIKELKEWTQPILNANGTVGTSDFAVSAHSSISYPYDLFSNDYNYPRNIYSGSWIMVYSKKILFIETISLVSSNKNRMPNHGEFQVSYDTGNTWKTVGYWRVDSYSDLSANIVFFKDNIIGNYFRFVFKGNPLSAPNNTSGYLKAYITAKEVVLDEGIINFNKESFSHVISYIDNTNLAIPSIRLTNYNSPLVISYIGDGIEEEKETEPIINTSQSQISAVVGINPRAMISYIENENITSPEINIKNKTISITNYIDDSKQISLETDSKRNIIINVTVNYDTERKFINENNYSNPGKVTFDIDIIRSVLRKNKIPEFTPNHNIAQYLIAWLPFKDSTIYDVLGNEWEASQRAIITSDNPFHQPALYLDGYSSIKSKDSFKLGGLTPFIIEFWIYIPSDQINTNSKSILDLFNINTGNSMFNFRLNSDKQSDFDIWTNSYTNITADNGYTDVASGYAPIFNSKLHIAIVYEPDNSSYYFINIYKNGSLKFYKYNNRSTKQYKYDDYKLNIGTWRDWTEGNLGLKAFIKDLRIYKKENLYPTFFTSPEIKTLYEYANKLDLYSPKVDYDIEEDPYKKYVVSHLKFDDIDNPVKDETGLEWEINGKPNLVLQTGIKGCKNLYGFNFDGHTYLQSEQLLLGGQDFTIDGWIYTRTNDDNNSGSRVFAITKDDINNYTMVELRSPSSSNGSISSYWRLMTNQSANPTSTSMNTNDSKIKPSFLLIHFAVVYQYEQQTMSFYVNGVRLAQNTSVPKYTRTNYIIQLGQSYSYYYTGTLDEFRVRDGIAVWTGERFNINENQYKIQYPVKLQEEIDITRNIFASKLLSGQWLYLNPGTADKLTLTGTTLTNLPETKSKTGIAFVQTAKNDCFDIPDSKELWVKFDVYTTLSQRWRAYAYNNTNSNINGICSQTSGEFDIWVNDSNTYSLSSSIKTGSLDTYVIHFISGASPNGVVEVWKNGSKVSKQTGNVCDGNDITKFYLQTDGNSTYFSNVVISNRTIDLNKNVKDYVEFPLNVTRSYDIIRSVYDDEYSLNVSLNTKVLLHFNDENDPFKDEIENEWIITGNPKILDNGGRFNKALQTYIPFTAKLENVELGGDKDFIIDFWYYVSAMVNTSDASNLFVIGLLNNLNNNYVLKISLTGTNITFLSNNRTVSISINKRDINYFYILYHSLDKKLYVFLNGEIYNSINISNDSIPRQTYDLVFLSSDSNLNASIDEFRLIEGIEDNKSLTKRLVPLEETILSSGQLTKYSIDIIRNLKNNIVVNFDTRRLTKNLISANFDTKIRYVVKYIIEFDTKRNIATEFPYDTRRFIAKEYTANFDTKINYIIDTIVIVATKRIIGFDSNLVADTKRIIKIDIVEAFDTLLNNIVETELINDTKREILASPDYNGLYIDTKREILKSELILFDTVIKTSGIINVDFDTKRLTLIDINVSFDTRILEVISVKINCDTKRLIRLYPEIPVFTKRIVYSNQIVRIFTRRNVVTSSYFFYNTKRIVKLNESLLTDTRRIISKEYKPFFDTIRKTVIKIYFELWTVRIVEKDITDFKEEIQRFYYLCTKFGDPFRYLDEDEAKRWYYYSKDRPLYPNLNPDIDLQTRSRFPERPLRDNLKISESKSYVEL